MPDTSPDHRRTAHHHQRKKRPLEDSNRPSVSRQIESFISKHLLKIFGVLFILASIWFAANSTDHLVNFIKLSTQTITVLQNPSDQPFQAGTSIVETLLTPAVSLPMILWVSISAAAVLLLLGLSTRFRRREIPRILVFVFYAVVLLLAKQFGWQVHLLFPLILFFSILLYLTAIRLHSTFALKLNVLFAWGVVSIWWGLNIILGGNRTAILPLFLYPSLFFLAFLFMGVNKGFKGYHKTSKYTEILVSSVNVMACFLIGVVTLAKFGSQEYLWVFSLGLALVLWVMLYLTSRFTLEFTRSPYLFSAIILISMVLPFLVRINAWIIFFGILSVLLMANSKFSGDRFSIIGSLVALLIMLLVYLHNWVFQYLPAVFTGDISKNTVLLTRGLIASLVVVPVLLVNSALLKDIQVGFSKKWFSKKSYLRIFKGILLFTLYLACFWIFHSAVSVWLANPEIKYLSWFTYSCLYFIVVIPLLANQKSSYLLAMVCFSLIISLAYPMLVHLSVLELRDAFLKHDFYSSGGFYFHYATVFLLIINLVITGYFVPRVFKEQVFLVGAIWIYIILLGLFLLLSEYDHLTVVLGLKKGVTINDIIGANRMIPYTITTLVYAFVLLMIGLLKNNRLLRAIAMVLLAVILGKVIYMDVKALEGMSKTLLLFLFGVVMLILSFFYPKIKRLFSGDQTSRRTHRDNHRQSNTTRDS